MSRVGEWESGFVREKFEQARAGTRGTQGTQVRVGSTSGPRLSCFHSNFLDLAPIGHRFYLASRHAGSGNHVASKHYDAITCLVEIPSALHLCASCISWVNSPRNYLNKGRRPTKPSFPCMSSEEEQGTCRQSIDQIQMPKGPKEP